jgi:predicted ferric reductase
MNQTTRTNLDDITPTLEPFELLMLLLAIAGGTFAAAVVLPMWLPGLSASLLGEQPKAYWYLARASGFVAFLVLWFSVALGLIITNKMARLWNGGPLAVEMHQFTTWLAVGLALFHAFILLGDQYIQSTPAQVLLPFGYVNYKPEWVGVGQIAFYLTIVVAASFYFRKRMGYHTWRTLHYTSFVVYLLVTVHGVFAGTDSAALMTAYLALGAGIYLLTMHRIFQSIKAPVAAHVGQAGRLEAAGVRTPSLPAPTRNLGAPARAVQPMQSGAVRPAAPAPAPPPAVRTSPPARASGE